MSKIILETGDKIVIEQDNGTTKVFYSNIGNIMNMLFTNGILFSFVSIATDPISSSYTKQGKIIFGILVGIFTFILYLINPILSSFGGILITSILNNVIDLKFE